MSPFKLYDRAWEQRQLVVEKAPNEFSKKEVHQDLLQLARIHAGYNTFADMDIFQHRLEDVMKSAVSGSLIRAQLELDNDFLTNIGGKKVSFVEKPHLYQIPFF